MEGNCGQNLTSRVFKYIQAYLGCQWGLWGCCRWRCWCWRHCSWSCPCPLYSGNALQWEVIIIKHNPPFIYLTHCTKSDKIFSWNWNTLLYSSLSALHWQPISTSNWPLASLYFNDLSCDILVSSSRLSLPLILLHWFRSNRDTVGSFLIKIKNKTAKDKCS